MSDEARRLHEVRFSDTEGYLVPRISLEDVEGPLRFFTVTPSAEAKTLFVRHQDGFVFEVSVETYHQRLAAAQCVFSRSSLPLEILRDLLPLLCEACGHPVPAGSWVCEACWDRMADDFVDMTGE